MKVYLHIYSEDERKYEPFRLNRFGSFFVISFSFPMHIIPYFIICTFII